MTATRRRTAGRLGTLLSSFLFLASVGAPALRAQSGASGPARSFEGVLSLRDIAADVSDVATLIPGAEGMDGDAFRSAVLQLPVDQVTALGADKVDVTDTKMYVKGRTYRVEGGMQAAAAGTDAGYMLIDFEHDVFRIVMPSRKAYIEWSGEDLRRMAAGRRARQPDEGSLQVQPMGATGQINGVPVAGYEVDGPEDLSRAWLTDRYPGLTESFRSFTREAKQIGVLGSADRSEVGLLVGKYGFPVRIQTIPTDATPDGGVDYQVQDVTKIDPRSLADSLFQVPAGYRKVTMGEMMQEMQGEGGDSSGR